ncbi:hypothetical protein [Flavobacterium sp.]|uniref:hypothetical protein n=1 Tax=Flavobacterium sp. TaxID=239 RepID=UPI00286CCD66|nr:hypothetical protein [Flavobacterium sp.]
MKKFIIKLLLFSILISGIVLIMLSRYGGYVDYFYNKVSSPRQSALIIGESRSFQGLQPAVINENLKGDFDLPIFNYSFTLSQATYGDGFLKSIKGKVKQTTRNGLFILSIQPWLMAEREGDTIEKGIFFEKDLPPHNMSFFAMNPNFEYFFKNYSYFHFKAIIKRTSKVHDDGWLEESNIPKDTILLNQWKQEQIKMYKGFADHWKKSAYRFMYLEKTIEFLKQHGTVVLVRIPCSKAIIAIEEQFWNGFDNDMNALAQKNQIQYVNYTLVENSYYSYDGVHLDKNSGAAFSKSLCDSIKSFNKLKTQ